MRAVVVYESIFGNTHTVAERITEGPGLRDWFDSLGTADHAVAAAFDTRAGTLGATVTGRASKGIHKRLHRHGFAEVLPAESFIVDQETHLMDGEEARAVEWGRRLSDSLDRT